MTSRMISSGNATAAAPAAVMALITAGSSVEQDGADQPAPAGAGQPERDAVTADGAARGAGGHAGGVDPQVDHLRGGSRRARRADDGMHAHEADRLVTAQCLPGRSRRLAGRELPFQLGGYQGRAARRVGIRPVVDGVRAAPRDIEGRGDRCRGGVIRARHADQRPGLRDRGAGQGR